MKRVCVECKKRPAQFKDGRGRIKADDDHKLCFRCYRTERDRFRHERHNYVGQVEAHA